MKLIFSACPSAQLEINYSHASVPAGAVTVASTRLGVCALEFAVTGHKDALLSLKRRFAGASFREMSDSFQITALDMLSAYIDRRLMTVTGRNIVLDLIGTPFRHRVWKELADIPYGETRSYSCLAGMAGCPKAVRAVASAVADNPVAVFIPCHRIIRSDGSPGGYRWGSALKEYLLALENGNVQPC